MSENRRFPRYAIPENAIALDASGRHLGRVSQAGGGGMLIEIAGEAISPAEFPPGRQMRITVLEPAGNVRNTVDVVVRYCTGTKVGAEFVSGRESSPK